MDSGATYEQDTKRAKTHTAPPRVWSDHLRHPSGLTPASTPALTPFKEQLTLPQGVSKGTYLFLFPPAAVEAPKSLAQVWPLVNFY